MRLRTYGLPVPGAVTDYIRRVCALPGVKAWMDDALAEHDFVDFDEPYRTARPEARSPRYTARMPSEAVPGSAARCAMPCSALPVNDDDWVVVGATPEDMIHAGYLPVGKDFPCSCTRRRTRNTRWRAPSARRRAATAASPSTPPPTSRWSRTCARRDLTINAMAQAEDGTLIDPFGGQRDLRREVLRHVTRPSARTRCASCGWRASPPLRRLHAGARDAGADARDGRRGEVDHLVPERVWQELARGLMEERPSRMFEVLRECGALERRAAGGRPAVGRAAARRLPPRRSTPACTS